MILAISFVHTMIPDVSKNLSDKNGCHYMTLEYPLEIRVILNAPPRAFPLSRPAGGGWVDDTGELAGERNCRSS